ncbi:MAG: sulfatase [Saprospiraceae bacterium]
MTWILSTSLLAAQAPNILWVVCEDISPTLSMYGESTAHTPHLDALAADGMVYERAFATVGVCGPSRSAIITGMYPMHIGTQHMRTGKDVQSWGKRTYAARIAAVDIQGDSLREYAAVLPKDVKCFPEYLRQAGYYCTNNQKTDYQFASPLSAWDENGTKAHWRNRPEGKPFFAVFNFGSTHESRLWLNANQPLTVDPAQVPVPPYLPDNETTRRDVARHYSNVEIMDAEVGRIIQQLKDDGLYDQTIIFFYSDHGGPLPRQKREVYDSGLRVPLIVKPLAGGAAGRSDRLVSFVDLAPTLLSIAGVVPPTYMDGVAFMGQHQGAEHPYILGSGDRFDEFTDRVRAVRNKRWLYVRNFFPALPGYKNIGYRLQIPMMEALLADAAAQRLNDAQARWFATKATEELYDCDNDPHNLHNLATTPRYANLLREMRETLLEEMTTHPDLGQVAEATLIHIMWPGDQQPQTSRPRWDHHDGWIHLHCSTPGASISYQYISADAQTPTWQTPGWQLYTTPIPAPQKGQRLVVIAERIGYAASELLVW